MSIGFDGDDFRKLIRILADLPEFTEVYGRISFIDNVLRSSPRYMDIKRRIQFNGPSQAVATQIVTLLDSFGQDEPGQETLTLLINTLIESLGGGNERKFLRELFAKYPLKGLPVANGDMGEWQGTDTADMVAEKIIGENTLRDVVMLEQALVAARAVLRIATTKEYGSGFMITKNLLMTNHHVLPNHETARQSTYTFNYQLDRDGQFCPVVNVAAEPDGQFYTNKELDFTVVELNNPPTDFIPLTPVPKRSSKNDRVSIIQHPGGKPKMISMQNNHVQFANARVVQYTTSTEPGSSGSPVLNDEFYAIAIHHAGGMLREPDTSKKYLRNEGISMIAILEDLTENAPEIAKRLSSNNL